MIKPKFALGALETLLDGPAQARDSRQLRQGGAWRREGQVVGLLGAGGALAPYQDPVFEALL